MRERPATMAGASNRFDGPGARDAVALVAGDWVVEWFALRRGP
jgi:hypothetical protein